MNGWVVVVKRRTCKTARSNRLMDQPNGIWVSTRLLEDPTTTHLSTGEKRRDRLEVMQEVSQEVLKSSHYCQRNSFDDDDDDDDDHPPPFAASSGIVDSGWQASQHLDPEACFNVCIVMGLHHRWRVETPVESAGGRSLQEA